MNYEIKYEFLSQDLGESKVKRDGTEIDWHDYSGAAELWRLNDIRITAGDFTWDTQHDRDDTDGKKMPRCEVGAWDDPNGQWDDILAWLFAPFVAALDSVFGDGPKPYTRDMDCRWEC